MFPLPISTYIYIAIALGTAFITHRVDGYYTEKAKLEAVEHVIAVQTKVVNDQAVISQRTQKDKDDLQTRYDGVVAMLRGVRNPNLSAGQSTTAAIPSQGLRLLEPDAEVLVGFARQCAATEIERNDVINKYNALMVTK
jgi:phage gp36-like protein